MSRQAPLALALPARDPAATFVAGPSTEAARAALSRWRDWPGGMLAVVGPKSAGKSHLAAVWTGETGAQNLPAEALVGDGGAVLAAARRGPLVIEDADRGDVHDSALMALVDAAAAGQVAATLVTARTPPARWTARRADLVSRLGVIAAVALETPDEDELRGVLQKLFADRGLHAADGVVEFLLKRIDLSVPAAVEIVSSIDALALETKARLTRRLAGEALSRMGYDGADDAFFDEE